MANNELQYQEDEIDLKQLACIVWASRKIIVVVTLVTTLLAGVYAFTKTPIYEVSALVEIGSYNLPNPTASEYRKVIINYSQTGGEEITWGTGNDYKTHNDTISLDSALDLAKKLNVVFAVSATNNGTSKGAITEISASEVNTHINITAQAISNESAAQKINELVNFIKTGHQQDLDKIKRQRELEIEAIEREIVTIHNTTIGRITEKIILQQEYLDESKALLNSINSNIKQISNSDPTLTALQLMEKRELSAAIISTNNQLIALRNMKEAMQTTVINKLLVDMTMLESLLLAKNYKNSEVVGKIITSDHPIKPKKKLIVAVAFIAGLMLSIFLVFIMNAFRSEDDKATA